MGLWNRLPGPARRADYVRTRLVHRHGGVWLDIDVIALSPLSGLFDMIVEGRPVFAGEDDKHPMSVNLFGAYPHDPILGAWLEEQDRVITHASDLNTLDWNALGSLILARLLPAAAFTQLPATRFLPLAWYEWQRFLSPYEPVDPILAHQPITVMLFNAVMKRDMQRYTADQLLHSPILVARLLRIGLGHSTVKDESAQTARIWRRGMLRAHRARSAASHKARAAQSAVLRWSRARR